MLEILGTYDDKSASEAKDDALQCILHCINKPDVYVMDHLLQLKPVIALEGQPILRVGQTFVARFASEANNETKAFAIIM